MKVAIIGTGAVGGYFGGRLANSGVDVSFLARGEHLAAMKRDGLRVESLQGDFQANPVNATDNLEELGPVDFVLVALKAWQVAEIASRLKCLLHSQTLVIPLQNGVEAPTQLAAQLGEQHVVGGFCRIIAFRAGPGLIRHVGAVPDIFFGHLDGHADPRPAQLQQAFENAGVKAAVSDNITAKMWEKFLFICSFGGVGALARAPIGIVRELPETRALLERCMGEIVILARALNIPLDDGLCARTMGYIDALPADAMTSLQRELGDGRVSELEAWNGAVVRLARKAGVATPVNDTLYAALLPWERRARGVLAF